jgi:hypothetical protein
MRVGAQSVEFLGNVKGENGDSAPTGLVETLEFEPIELGQVHVLLTFSRCE